MASYLRPRRGKKATAESQNIILKRGEVFFEAPTGGVGTGTGRIKIGDGTTAYTSLPYFLNPDNFVSDISTATVSFTETAVSDNSTLLATIVTGAGLNTIVAAVKNLLSNLNSSVTSINNDLTANNTPFKFGYDDATSSYGYILNEGGADTVIPFKRNTIHTDTYTASSRSAALDMGETHTYRYVNTDGVPNSNSTTYTYPANSTGGKVDLGATNTYRYVVASNVYSKGVTDGRAMTSKNMNFTSAANGYNNFGPFAFTTRIAGITGINISNSPMDAVYSMSIYNNKYVRIYIGNGQNVVTSANPLSITCIGY